MSYEHEWLDLIDISGPFLAVPVLKNALEQGLPQLEPKKKKDIRQAYDEWREALDESDPDIAQFHAAWVSLVLKDILELDEDESGETLTPAAKLPDNLTSHVLEHGVTLQPDYAVIDDQHADKPLMLIKVYEPEVDLSESVKGDGWASTPADRMVQLCRDTGTRLGILTNGEQWMFVDAPVGAVTSFATWYARLWSQEPETLQAFISLFGVRRFFLDKAEQLPALLDQSLKYQDEVTDALGDQVRRAVEVLIQALDKANIDDDGKLLAGIEPRELYEAGLTVMMRLVFLLSAEERELLLLGDERYDANYAVSTLRMQLRAESDEILDRRWDAWSRLLATFRAVYGGIEHETLRMPALGGSLFDPDRFPFLEGRAKDSDWKEEAAHPLPINNHTVLLLLDAIQLYQGRALSYRGLDIEQLGYVYEGLLDHTVKRAKEVTLELDATKNAKQPWVTLHELGLAKEKSTQALEGLLKDRTGSSISRVRNDLKKEVSEEQAERLLNSCQNDPDLQEQLKPYFHLIRPDSWDYPLVYPEGSFMVTTGEDRRQSGSHYTPVSLTEAIVRETLEPVVYVGPAEGKPREEWQLKSPAELLDLKICDPAMGSGAFLVQVCRWLGERVVESWVHAEAFGKHVDVDGQVSADETNAEPLPKDLEERAVIARRLIAERCIYGVDLNPLAVELAKLSVWLVTMAKGRPFGFLDHNLKCGDSLLGIHHLEQLTELSLDPSGSRQTRLFGQSIQRAVKNALELRSKLRNMPIRDIADVENMASLDAEARGELKLPEHIGNAFIGAVFAAENSNDLERQISNLSVHADEAVAGDVNALAALRKGAERDLAIDSPNGRIRRPLNWALEFPEVFDGPNSGFNAMLGNPPFIGGRRMRAAIGRASMNWLTKAWPHASMNADICVFFYLRSAQLLRPLGELGFLGTKTIGQGDTARTGLAYLLAGKKYDVRFARSSFSWPGTASVVTALVIIHKGQWNGERILDGRKVDFISAVLDEQMGWGESKRLRQNAQKSFQGSVLVGMGFVLTESEVKTYISKRKSNKQVIKPYLSGDDLNTHPQQLASRWAIDFRAATLEECTDKWPELIGRIRKTVKPQRDKVRREAHRRYWWQHGDKRPALYASIAHESEVFVIARVTKYVAIARVSAEQVFHDKVYVFNLPGWNSFAALQSSFHDVWVRRGSSTVGETLNYTPSDYFDTYPFLHIEGKELQEIGQRYYSYRAELMMMSEEGLTKIYNRFHDPADSDEDILLLRDIHREMDLAVASAYGWSEIELDHGFHELSYLPENDRVRFTISANARRDVLRLLSELNRQIHDDEITSESSVRKSLRNSPKRKSNSASESKEQQSIDFGIEPSSDSSDL